VVDTLGLEALTRAERWAGRPEVDAPRARAPGARPLDRLVVASARAGLAVTPPDTARRLDAALPLRVGAALPADAVGVDLAAAGADAPAAVEEEDEDDAGRLRTLGTWGSGGSAGSLTSGSCGSWGV
jgi:hypothetical protein